MTINNHIYNIYVQRNIMKTIQNQSKNIEINEQYE